jgi:ABC-2 type transport system permease protein
MDRYRTLHDSLAQFLTAKVAFVGLMLAACTALLFEGGALLFGVAWQRPGSLLALVVAYVLFAAGLMALTVALVPDQRKADALRSALSVGLALAGGCAFPPESFPAFLRERVMPWLPTYWFASTARALEFGGGAAPWLAVAVKLAGVGMLSLGLSAWLLRRRLSHGGRA